MAKIIKIKDIDELIKTMNSYSNSYVFRGHADSDWKLATTLERLSSKPKFPNTFEEYSLNEFKAKFHLYDRANITPNSKLEWLSLMQHYGVPTRLLDLTTSPYVALFFAIEAYDTRTSPDFSVYAFNYTETMQISLQIIKEADKEFNETENSIIGRQDEIFEKTIDRFNYDLVWITEPARLNIRIDRQSGCFALSGNKHKNIDQILSSEKYATAQFEKIIISKELFNQCYALLRKMNISPKTIYGDLVGLAKFLAMEGKIYSI